MQDSAVAAIKALHNPNIKDSESHTDLLSAVTKVNPQIMSSIDMEHMKRISPQYIEENRIKEYIKYFANSVDEVEIPENLVYRQEVLNRILQDKTIASMDLDKVTYLLSMIEKDIDNDNKTKEISIMLHTIISDTLRKTNPLSFDAAFAKSFKANKTELYGPVSEDNTEAWKKKIYSMVGEISVKINNTGIPITNLYLSSHEDTKTRVKGQIDLVAVDSSGIPHIFDIVTSKNSFSSWDPAKKLTSDWTLALKRQLLGQSVRIDRSTVNIIPIVVQGFGSPSLVTLDNFENRSGDITAGLGPSD